MKRLRQAMLLILLMTGGIVYGQVKQTKHNLSATGPGNLRTSDTTEICVFCHTSHSATPATPLWNRESGPVVYNAYDSTTLEVKPGQPDGASRLCLSCHDGTVALGAVRRSDRSLRVSTGSGGKIPRGRSNLGFDLSDDHPTSFAPAYKKGLVDPPKGDLVHYDRNGRMQCTSCHDPHDDPYGQFLLKSNQQGLLCKTCHQMDQFDMSSHNNSMASWNGNGQTPWPRSPHRTVLDNACANCHVSHGAGAKQRLITREEHEQCLSCHQGNVASGNIKQVMVSAQSGHNVLAYAGIHDPREDPRTMARHVTCSDCHNPHAVTDAKIDAPGVSGAISGVAGLDINGNKVEEIRYSYELCLKCHSDNLNFHISSSLTRVDDTSSIRTAIHPGNASFHPIADVGRSMRVPSLKSPYTVSSQIGCIDCHNSDRSERAGGRGPDGPHGSANSFILEARYDTADRTAYSRASYALCFKCHDENRLFSGSPDGFEYHELHVRQEDTPCSVCHDAHGSQRNIALINFDTSVVFPTASGVIDFTATGEIGSCSLNCHGETHNAEEYLRR